MKTRHKISLARTACRLIGAARRPLRLGSIVDVRRAGLNWRLDLDEGIDLAIYLLGTFERRTARVFRRLVPPGATVLDVGANVGAHTLQLARLVGEKGRVVAYEPTRFAFAKLEANLSLNPGLRDRVTLVPAFLGDDGEPANPAVWASWPLRSSEGLHPDHGGRLMGTDNARNLTLDEHMTEIAPKCVSFIKMDVDGHECSVLRGGRRLLERDRPMLLFEAAPYLHRELGHPLATCLETLASLGYQLHDAASGRPLPSDLRLLDELVGHGASANVIAQPRP